MQWPERNAFSIHRNVCVDIETIDPATRMVHTKTPHKIPDTHESVALSGFSTDLSKHVENHYMVSEIVDEYTLRLESSAELPPSLIRGQLARDGCSVLVPRSQCTGSGVASLVGQVPKSTEACLQDWRAAVRAARQMGIMKSLPAVLHPILPDTDSLHVEQCGWRHCEGVFRHNGHMQFTLGPLVSIVYSEELSMWCLLADVTAAYPLEEQRCYLGLGDWDGPQLLYVRQDPSPTGRWEPVIGPGPGPTITAHREMTILLSESRQPSLLLHPSVGSVVLDMLFNYLHADWRGGFTRGRVCHFSSLEAIIAAFGLWRGVRTCSAVCRTWQVTLKPFGDLVQICHHALQIPQESKLPLPTIQQAVQAIMLSGSMWSDGLSVVNFNAFLEHLWPSKVEQVELSSELNAPCAKWGFPKIRGTFLGVPIIRTIVFWGLYLGPFGKLPN